MVEDSGRENAYPMGKYPAVNQNELLLLRALAIQAYAILELSLSNLFSQWLGTTSDVGGLVFFRITSTHTRNTILKDLKRKRLQDHHERFWKSLWKFISKLDDRRHEIVHWALLNNIDLNLPHEKASKLTLSPLRGLSNPHERRASIDEKDLNDFIKRCEFASSVLMVAYMSHDERVPKFPREYLDIFNHPLDYPPPDDHPFSPTHRQPQTPAKGATGPDPVSTTT
jgi:hypothetical protein